jgi:hypothetical protein
MIFVVTSISACSQAKDVYIAGFYTPAGGSQTPCYWKNGARIDLALPKDGNILGCSTTQIVDNNLIITGFYGDSSGVVPCFWQNGIRADITSLARGESIPWFVIIDKGISYVFGSRKGGIDSDINCVWINGKPNDILLPEGKTTLNIETATVLDGSLYFAGSAKNNNGSESFLYCANGKWTDLPIPSGTQPYYGGFIGGNSWIAVSAGRLDILSMCRNLQSNENRYCYWVNSKPVDLSFPSDAKNMSVSRVFASNGSIYITGRFSNTSGDSIPCYWVNGKRIDLSPPSGGTKAVPTAIAAANGHIAIAGRYIPKGGDSYSICYWMDDHVFELEGQQAWAGAIAIGHAPALDIPSKPNLIGQWVIHAKDESASFEFVNEKMGRVREDNDSTAHDFTYIFDTSAKPCKLTILAATSNSIQGVVEFLDANTFRAEFGDDSSQPVPTSFTDKAWIFTRSAPITTKTVAVLNTNFMGAYINQADYGVYRQLEFFPQNVVKVHSLIGTVENVAILTYERRGSFIFIKTEQGEMGYEILDDGSLKGPGGTLIGGDVIFKK